MRSGCAHRKGSVVLALVLGIGAATGALSAGSHLCAPCAKQEAISAVTPITFGPPSWVAKLGIERSLPLVLSAGEEQALRRAIELSRLIRGQLASGVRFGDTRLRDELRQMLRLRPRLFYAQHVLAAWHLAQGEEGAARELRRQAEAAAPVVLVQGFETARGGPLVGARIPLLTVENNRMQHSVLDTSLRLEYVGLVTDEAGRVRLPVYDTLYRLVNDSHPPGYRASYKPFGWFYKEERIAELPVATVERLPSGRALGSVRASNGTLEERQG